MSDARKNVVGLVNAFHNQARRMPNARLLIKASGASGWAPPDISVDPRIIYLPAQLTDSEINALYELSHVYVSAHHSEGWGLTMSDAMIFKKPVIATGYSGNMEFMEEDNSFLVDFDEERIRPQDEQGLYKGSMKWAYPRPDSLEENLTLCHENINEDWIGEKTRRAEVAIRRFDHEAVGNLITQRLSEISGRL
jgi:glycosyltransferase involved in cell wall biosynthesis